VVWLKTLHAFRWPHTPLQEFEVRCAECDKWTLGEAPDAALWANAIRSEGWEIALGIGWVCGDCRGWPGS
jgi:hypothetical protein